MATLLPWRAHWRFPGVRSSDSATNVRTVRSWAIAALLLVSLSGCATSQASSSSNPTTFPSGTGGVGGGTALGTNTESVSPTPEATPTPKATSASPGGASTRQGDAARGGAPCQQYLWRTG